MSDPLAVSHLLVADAMNHNVLTVSPTQTVRAACRQMVERSVGSVIVCEGSSVTGIFTERDLVRAVSADSDLQTCSVSEWMTPNPDSVSPSEPCQAAFIRLMGAGYRHIPVLDEGKLVGMVSMRDLLWFASTLLTGSKESADTPLGDRQIEVLRLVSRGYTSRQIAERLHLAHATVRNHVSDILAKLQVSSRAEAVNVARESDLI